MAAWGGDNRGGGGPHTKRAKGGANTFCGAPLLRKDIPGRNASKEKGGVLRATLIDAVARKTKKKGGL